MAVGTMESITSTLTALGRDAREPALIVERCGFRDEQMVAGRLGDIAERAHRAGLRPPALPLIGSTPSAASATLTVARLTTAEATASAADRTSRIPRGPERHQRPIELNAAQPE